MSLRAEIHDALDEVTPPAPHLELQVRALVLDHARDRKHTLRRGGRPGWTMPLRGLVPLVAAALVVALIGGLILGGRILRDLHPQPQTINQPQLKNLESQPLQFPVVVSGGTCPTSPLTDASAHGEAFVFGVGPVYSTPLASSSATTSWGTWTVLSLIVDTTKASGLILVRAQDLQTNAMVLFARTPHHAIDQAGDGIPTGKVIGSQVLEGEKEQLYPEMVIDTTRPWEGTKKGNWPIFKGYMGYSKAATGCLGFQIDGTNFTELVVISA